MLNGCKSCSIFAIRDIELYFIFIAKAYKTGNINLGVFMFIVDTVGQC